MPIFEKHFTLAEANALVPWVRETFEEFLGLEEKRQVPTDSQMPAPFVPAGKNGKRDKNAPPDPVERMRELLEEVVARGIVIQDPRRGLIDFPGWRAGEEIFLCYELADGDAIQAWHSLEGGYAGRRPLDDSVE